MRSERGSAVVDFLLVSLLVTVLVLGVVQLALTLHVRNILIDSASEGARYAALEGSSLAAGQQRTADLITSTLPDFYAENLEAGYLNHPGATLVEIRVSAPIPVLGLLGPSGVVNVTGRAVQE
ncbi:pilus assembly protein [Occultella glacieicola]|uniref:Pilus assembly protein n=1 Tax=Occultella glacieicola TaxID=2518684 RepID=A0ABY2E7A8_9MICO|nr:TadE/TadG family type IV pilus assembly protein [Occultella glacieicola]TDE97441.1 pilus assembly protein [Occultella glacieicola]